MAADGDKHRLCRREMDVPLIRRFACGYVLGARHAMPGIRVFQNMTGTTSAGLE